MTEEREHLQKLIELHRANLQHYEEQEAKCKIAEARKGRRGRRGIPRDPCGSGLPRSWTVQRQGDSDPQK